LSARAEAGGTHRGFSGFTRRDSRNDYRRSAQVAGLQNQMREIVRDPDDRHEAVGCAGPRHVLQRLHRERSVLCIEDHEVEAAGAQDVDHLGCADLRPGAGQHMPAFAEFQ
jgi:hypothetical protein